MAYFVRVMAFELKISLYLQYHNTYSFYNFDLLIFQSMGLRLHNPQNRVLDNVSI